MTRGGDGTPSARPAGTILAFDFGTRRIGVAVGEPGTGLAHPLTTIAAVRRDERFKAIGNLIEEWRPTLVLIGLPTHADGAEHELTASARRFARQLEGRFGVTVALADERFTTLAAARGARDGRREARAINAACATRSPRNSSCRPILTSAVQKSGLPDAEAALVCAGRAHARRGRHRRPPGRHFFGRRVAGRPPAALLPGEHPVGYIDVSFYRDDYATKGLRAKVETTVLPFDIAGARIVLVDDVLYTGRSVRAAINELFDYGRPESIELAVLDRPRGTRAADRGHVRRRARRRRSRSVRRAESPPDARLELSVELAGSAPRE